MRQETLNLGIAANPLTPLDLLEELSLGQNYPTIVAAANPNANHELATLAIGAVSGMGSIDPFLTRSNPDTGWVDDDAFEYVMQEVQVSRSCIFWECLLHPDSPGVQELFDYDSPSDPEEWEGLLDDLTQCAERNRNIASLAYRSSWEPFRAAVGETPLTFEERQTDQLRSTPSPPLQEQEVETEYGPKPSDDRTQRQIPLELPATDWPSLYRPATLPRCVDYSRNASVLSVTWRFARRLNNCASLSQRSHGPVSSYTDSLPIRSSAIRFRDACNSNKS